MCDFVQFKLASKNIDKTYWIQLTDMVDKISAITNLSVLIFVTAPVCMSTYST